MADATSKDAKINCSVPADLAGVIKLANIELGGKIKALQKFVELALEFERSHPPGPLELPEMSFGSDSFESCTLGVPLTFWDGVKPYRLRFLITNKTQFFLHALKLGATLWRASLEA